MTLGKDITQLTDVKARKRKKETAAAASINICLSYIRYGNVTGELVAACADQFDFS